MFIKSLKIITIVYIIGIEVNIKNRVMFSLRRNMYIYIYIYTHFGTVFAVVMVEIVIFLTFKLQNRRFVAPI